MKRDHDLEYEPPQVVVSSGGKNSLYNLVQAVIDPGDEAIVPAPYWVSYTDIVVLAGGVPVVVETGATSGFKMTPEQLESAITPRTRLLILNSPSNPTGACYRKNELEGLAEVLRRHPDVVVATDDMYEKIMWDDEPFSNILMAAPDLVDRTVVLNGVSKAYAMTGWRIGYAAGPDPISAAMRKIQSQCTSNPCSVSQAAAATAISGDHAYVEERSRIFQERGDYVNRRLNELRGVACVPGRGAFYAFPDFGEAIAAHHNANDDIAYAEWLLEVARVAVVPGSAFGASGFMRLSFATSMENLEAALDRLGEAMGTK